MFELAETLPKWAVGMLLFAFVSVLGMAGRVLANRYSRLENRVDKLETACHSVETQLQKKADYSHLEKEVSKLADRNHADLKEIQRQIADSMKTMHGRLDDLHVIFINFLNSKRDD